MHQLTHIGLDVHKDTIAVAILRPGSTECDERVIPNSPGAIRKLLTRHPDPSLLRTCYEAGPTGYDTHRLITSLGVACDVIAPSLIPRRGKVAGKRHISERPPEVEGRVEIGHWEIDTVMGTEHGRNSVLTLVERATGYTVMGKLERHCAGDAVTRCVELVGRHVGRVATITADNGSEFHSYKEIERATGVDFYFATPHHSWERGTNENTNGLIRQYLPKRTSQAHVTQTDCDRIAAKLNSRPRKRLGYKTPEECYAATR